jgi:uncharacterized protein (TIGR02145 family)
MNRSTALLFTAALLCAGMASAKEHLDDPGVAHVAPNQVVKGSMVDSRNKVKYATVRIGTQSWMAENLDFKTGNSWCYGDDPDNCEKYGRLYDWKTATTVCPGGWHLPSDDEWRVLEKAIGGKETGDTKLKSSSGWDDKGSGTDDYGFTVLPAGYRNNDGRFNLVGSGAYFWSATGDDGGSAWDRGFSSGDAEVSRYQSSKTTGQSVRCLEN